MAYTWLENDDILTYLPCRPRDQIQISNGKIQNRGLSRWNIFVLARTIGMTWKGGKRDMRNDKERGKVGERGGKTISSWHAFQTGMSTHYFDFFFKLPLGCKKGWHESNDSENESENDRQQSRSSLSFFFYNESQNNSSKSQSYKGEREEILQTWKNAKKKMLKRKFEEGCNWGK